jgi:hypothetical protein
MDAHSKDVGVAILEYLTRWTIKSKSRRRRFAECHVMWSTEGSIRRYLGTFRAYLSGGSCAPGAPKFLVDPITSPPRLQARSLHLLELGAATGGPLKFSPAEDVLYSTLISYDETDARCTARCCDLPTYCRYMYHSTSAFKTALDIS